MKERKGSVWGVENLGSIILAVLAVVALGFLAVKLYNLFIDQEKKNAQEFIDSLNAKIEALDENVYCDLPQASPPSEVGFSPPECEISNTFAMRGIEGWVLVGWNKNVSIVKDEEIVSMDKKPSKCFDKNCLCICLESIDQCEESGYCRFPDRSVSVKSFGSVDFVKGYSAGMQGVTVFAEGNFSSSCMFFKDNLLKPIEVVKGNNKIDVNYDYGFISSDTDYYDLRNNLKCNFMTKGQGSL